MSVLPAGAHPHPAGTPTARSAYWLGLAVTQLTLAIAQIVVWGIRVASSWFVAATESSSAPVVSRRRFRLLRRAASPVTSRTTIVLLVPWIYHAAAGTLVRLVASASDALCRGQHRFRARGASAVARPPDCRAPRGDIGGLERPHGRCRHAARTHRRHGRPSGRAAAIPADRRQPRSRRPVARGFARGGPRGGHLSLRRASPPARGDRERIDEPGRERAARRCRARCCDCDDRRARPLRAEVCAFSYRLVHLDSGVALAYAHATASALTLLVREVDALDEVLAAELLGIHPRWDFPIPTAAFGLGEWRSIALALARGVGRVTGCSHTIPIAKTCWLACWWTRARRRSHLRCGRCRSSALRCSSGRGCSSRLLWCVVPCAHGRGRAAGARRCARCSTEVMRSRRRARSTVDRRASSDPCSRSPVTPCRPAARAVRALGDELVRMAEFDGRAMRACTNQEGLSHAPAAPFVAIAAAATTRGARGYREAAQHAGAVGHAWLVGDVARARRDGRGWRARGRLARGRGLDPRRACARWPSMLAGQRARRRWAHERVGGAHPAASRCDAD